MYGIRGIELRILRKTVRILLTKQSYLFSVSMMEISGCEFFDLINPTQKVKLNQSARLSLSQTTIINVKSEQHFDKLVDKAVSRRIQKSTNQNNTSSRSHAVTILNIENVKKQKILFVDLAGYESPNEKTMSETKFINSSLSALSTALLNLSRGMLPSFTNNPLMEILKPFFKEPYCKALMLYHIRLDHFDQGLRYIKEIAVKVTTKSVVKRNPNTDLGSVAKKAKYNV